MNSHRDEVGRAALEEDGDCGQEGQQRRWGGRHLAGGEGELLGGLNGDWGRGGDPRRQQGLDGDCGVVGVTVVDLCVAVEGDVDKFIESRPDLEAQRECE